MWVPGVGAPAAVGNRGTVGDELGESVVYWLDNALLSGDATGASVTEDCGVLYFALDEQGLARA
jgi:hypothetical protein